MAVTGTPAPVPASPVLAPGASALAGTGAGVPVTATVAYVDGDSTNVTAGWVLVVFIPRS